jgi:hypothetical protein
MIWVDITNQPHILFFKDFIKRHEVLVTTREFGSLTDLLDSHGIEYICIGFHGGNDPKKKLIESAKRISGLAEIVSKENIKAAISKQSVELPRVAFGLGVPAIHVVDNEYAEKQNRLSLSLCDKIVVPFAVDKKKLISQGAIPENIVEFNGLCELAHIRNFKPDEKILEKYGVDDYVLIRPEPYLASYFYGRKITEKLIETLQEKSLQVVVIPRDIEYKGVLNLRNIDTLSLIYYSRVVLSGGGTMNRESALLGTPTISFYPQDLLGVDRFLIEKGLLYHSTEIKEIASLVESLWDSKNEIRNKATSIINTLQDPFEIIEREISNLLGQSS